MLTRDNLNPTKAGEGGYSLLHPVKAVTTIYQGSIVAAGADNLLVPAQDVAGLTVKGVAALAGINNVGGDGTLPAFGEIGEGVIAIDRGIHVFQVKTDDGAGNPLAVQPAKDAVAYLVDNNTVTADPAATANAIPVGIFVRPDDAFGPNRWSLDFGWVRYAPIFKLFNAA